MAAMREPCGAGGRSMKDVIVITGASSGFGALAARALAPAISPASTQSSRSPWRPSRRAGRRKAQEWACGPSAVVAAGVKPADYIVRTTTAPAEVALVVDDAPDEESASATTFTLSHLGGAPADVR